MIRTRAGNTHKKRRKKTEEKKEEKEEEKEEGKSEEEGKGERCESVGRRKKKEERRECAAAAAAAAVGDPHSLIAKVVTLPTSQPPMGWLKALAW